MSGSDRGASEVVGFALVFAIVFAGVGAVYAGGYETLTTVHDRQQTASAEEGLVVLQRSVTDVRSTGVRRSGVITLAGGRLTVDTGPTVSVLQNGTNRSFVSGGLSYRTRERSLTIASGGLFQRFGNRSVVAQGPDFVCRPSATVAIVTTTAFQPNSTGIDTDGPVDVRLNPVSRTTWHGGRVFVNLSEASNRDAWGRYLSANGWTLAGPSVYECQTDNAVVHQSVVRVEFGA